MKIRLIQNYERNIRGDILTVQHDVGDRLIKLGIAVYEPDHNSTLVSPSNEEKTKKTVDEAPRDKMVRRGGTRRKSRVD